MAKQNIKRVGDAQQLDGVIPTPSHNRVYLSYWSTPEALATHVASLGNGENNWSKSAWSHGNESFYGSTDMQEALAVCRAGWPVGADRASRLRDRINAANPMGPRVTRWDVAGAIASVPRALAGNPLNMRRVDSSRLKRKPVLTLLSDMSANATVDGSAITNRAAVVAAVVDAIEAAGFACEVVTFEHSANKDLSQVVATTVKESGAPADIGRLAFALGHASFFRRMAWAAFTCDPFTAALGSSLGHATTINQTRANENGVYVLPSAGANVSAFKTEDSAATEGLAFLIAALRKQGCPAFPREESNAA